MSKEILFALLEAVQTKDVHMQSFDRLRRMFYSDGQWEVWGQDRKWDREHLIEKSPDISVAIKALVGDI